MQDRARLTGLQSSPYKSALFYCYVSILVIQQAESWKDDHKFYELQIIIYKVWCINQSGQWQDASPASILNIKIAANVNSINVH